MDSLKSNQIKQERKILIMSLFLLSVLIITFGFCSNWKGNIFYIGVIISLLVVLGIYIYWPRKCCKCKERMHGSGINFFLVFECSKYNNAFRTHFIVDSNSFIG